MMRTLIVALVTVAPLIGVGCDRAGTGRSGGQAIAVRLVTLQPTQLRDTTEYVATLKSRRSIVLQPQVDGQLTRIFVKSGDTVEADQPIMQIDPARQRASVTSVQATQASRQATLNYAKQQFERAERLYEGGAVSQQELDQARSSFHTAQAELSALEAQVRENEVQLDYYRVTAPAHGVVGDIPVRVGDRVTPSTLLTTIDENGLLEVYISVPVEQAPRAQARPAGRARRRRRAPRSAPGRSPSSRRRWTRRRSRCSSRRWCRTSTAAARGAVRARARRLDARAEGSSCR